MHATLCNIALIATRHGPVYKPKSSLWGGGAAAGDRNYINCRKRYTGSQQLLW